MKKFSVWIVILGVWCLGGFSIGAQTSHEGSAPWNKGITLVEPYRSLPVMISRSLTPEAIQQIEEKIRTLSAEEKLGQLVMPIIYPKYSAQEVQRLRRMVEKGKIGGILFQKGDVWDQYLITRSLQEFSSIPLLISLDGEWGLSMRLSPTIRYPKMRSLANVRNLDLLRQYGQDVAEQCKMMGIHINFSPVVDVNNNPKNPVIGIRSFSEDPDRVIACALSYARGLEQNGILSVAKHFPGHGNTHQDSHKELPHISSSRSTLYQTELRPFRKYFSHGFGGVMVGHLSVPALDPTPSTPTSMSRVVVTDLLQKEMGFKGLIFTDALEMQGALRKGGQPISVQALLAGNHILLGGKEPDATLSELVQAYRQGVISLETINERCRIVLAYKYILCGGLETSWQAPRYSTRQALINALNAKPYQERAMQLWREGIETVHTRRIALPLLPKSPERYAFVHVHHDGKPSDPLERAFKKQGFSVVASYHIHPSTPAKEIEKIFKALKSQSDKIILAVYDSRTAYAAATIARKMPRNKVIFAGFMSPYQTEPWKKSIQLAGAALLAYENLPQAHTAMVDKWLNTTTQSEELSPEEKKREEEEDPTIAFIYRPRIETVTSSRWVRIDSVVQDAIRRRVFPGCQIVVRYQNQEILNQAWGRTEYDPTSRAVTPYTLYDVASLTKMCATTPAIMYLWERGKISLEDSVAKYLPEMANSDLGRTTLRQLLLHQSGLPAGLNFMSPLMRSSSFGSRTPGQGTSSPLSPYNEEWISPNRSDRYSQHWGSDYFLNHEYYTVMALRLASLSLRPSKKSVYSDLGFVTLGKIIEKVTKQPLNHFVETTLYPEWGIPYLSYLPLTQGWCEPEDIAPAQMDDLYRRGKVQGWVDDETAACLGGVSGNAGLFGNATAIALVAQRYLDATRTPSSLRIQAPKSATIRLFTQTQSTDSKRSLGFMRNYKGNSQLPPQAPPSTYGHTGFTGTCAWIDPKNELIFVFLSNRTYPSRGNTRLNNEGLRASLMGYVYDVLALNS